jgi:hypothetical protein
MHRPLWTAERGEMLLVMVGITAVLLGLAGYLVQRIGRPVTLTPAQVAGDAAFAGASVLRTQAITGGLRAADMAAPERFDVPAACAAARRTAAGEGFEVSDCQLAPTGLTVVLGRDVGQVADQGASLTGATAALVDTADGCLALRGDWGEALPAVCPDGPAGSADSASTR